MFGKFDNNGNRLWHIFDLHRITIEHARCGA